MKSWRGERHRNGNANQPFLPGLLGGSGAPKMLKRRPSSPGESALLCAQTRLPFVFLFFCLFFIVISGRLTLLAIGNDPREPPVIQAASGLAPVTARADILDRNGTVLATSLPTVLLMANTRNILDAKEAAAKLAEVFPDLDAQKLEKELAAPKRYTIVRRHLTPRQYYAVNKMGIAGLEFMPDESRIYPAGTVTSHVLGYTDIDNIGIAGLEKSLNSELQTKPAPVTTSLDIRLQTILHRELANAIKEYKALGGAGIIMDAHNGEVLALVSLPDFDPQNAGSATDEALFNNATLGVYEMGSTFKIFNTAMALDSGQMQIAERFDTIHPIEIGGKRIRDFHPSKYWLNLAEIFVESSNIGSARMAARLGAEKQRAFLQRLGLTEKPKFELPEVGTPLVPSISRWGDTATMTISFGHGIAVSALQVITAAATLVNDGFRITPTLLKRNEKATAHNEEDRLIKERTSAQMRALLRLVVKYGTAQKADAQGYMVGGKTGTADKLAGRKYSEVARISSFIGVFPSHAPRYLILALLDDPKGNASTYGFATAGWTAAPIVSKVVSQIGPLLNLAPVETDVAEAVERRLMRPLGNNVVETLKLDSGINDYASVESNSAR